MTKPQDIDLEELEDKGICTECGAIIHHTAHYCEFCKLRVSVPIEIEPIVLFFKQFLANKLNRIENEIDVWKEKQCDCFDDNKNKADEECFSCSQLRIVNKLIRKEFTK